MDQQLEKLKYSLLHNNPNLFIGAGFSLGAFQKNGQEVPSGRILKEDIIKNILGFTPGSAEYKELSTMALYKLCTHTYIEKGKEVLYDYLKNIFSGVKPCPFHKQYISYPWNKVFSTNIDDIIENICANEKVPIVIRNEKNNTRLKSDDEIDLYKLHGCVNNIDSGLIFDEEEYLSTIVDRSDYRFTVLSIELQNKDFIFVGSEFDDFNIKYYLNLYSSTTDSSSSTRGNLFFINPYPTLGFRTRIKSVNGILIEQTAEQFADFLQSIEIDRESIDETKLLYQGYVKLKQKRLNAPQKAKYNSNLYLGAYPKWEDIFYDWDILLPDVVNFKEILNDFTVSNKKSLVFSVFGNGYSGKSTFLKRLGQILLDENYDAISFEGQDFNVQKILRYIESAGHEKYALVIDDASYLYNDFQYICRRIPSNVKLCIVSSSRLFFHSKRRYSLVDMNCVEYKLDTPIDSSLAENVVDKLQNMGGYLGLILSDYPDRNSQISYAQSFPDIASSIFAITHGKNFKKRFTDDVNEILKEGYHRDVLIKLAIFQKLQLPYFPNSLFTNIYKKQAITFLKRIEVLIRSTGNGRIELKNEFIGDVILKNITPTEILQSIKKILTSISSMVQNSSNSYWNELQSVLIREKLIKECFKIDSKDFKEMLYEIRPYYSEDYNYWLQLGIAEQIDGDLEKALIHFNLAQQYGPRSYMVKNAIGRNFIFQALREKDYTIAKNLFAEGKDILFDLIKSREEYQVKAYSIHTYVTGLIRFYKTKKKVLKISKSEIQEAQSLIDGMVKKYSDDPKFTSLAHSWTKFVLNFSSAGMKFNLQEIQGNYKSLSSEDIDFEDFE